MPYVLAFTKRPTGCVGSTLGIKRIRMNTVKEIAINFWRRLIGGSGFLFNVSIFNSFSLLVSGLSTNLQNRTRTTIQTVAWIRPVSR